MAESKIVWSAAVKFSSAHCSFPATAPGIVSERFLNPDSALCSVGVLSLEESMVNLYRWFGFCVELRGPNACFWGFYV